MTETKKLTAKKAALCATACRVTIPAITLLVASATAQLPVPTEPGVCGGVRDTIDTSRDIVDTSRDTIDTSDLTIPRPREFSLRGSGFCSEYSIPGWDGTMVLYLGEGSENYRDLISKAVDLWNGSLTGFNRKPIITVNLLTQPQRFSLQEGFWNDPNGTANVNLYDGQSVIYFSNSGSASSPAGIAYRRADYLRMLESDIYINTNHQETYGRNLANTELILRLSEEQGVYGLVDSTYLTIIHEIGHALGLNHVPIAGNIMSYSYMPGIVNHWKPTMILLVSIYWDPDSEDTQTPFVYEDSDVSPYMVVEREDMLSAKNFFSDSVKLGEQDRISLMCVYDFEDWNNY